MHTKKHTDGPWYIALDPASFYTVVRDSRDKAIASMHVNDMANALLVAAVPDLLAALKELCSDKYLADPINAERMKNARAAIAKAEGKE